MVKHELTWVKKTILHLTGLFWILVLVSTTIYIVQAADTYTVQVAKGYLALRTAKAYDDNNEIGELYSGQQVEVQDTSDDTYWFVYAPSLGKSGYVNRNYLVKSGTSSIPSSSGTTMTVQVSKGFLALRTAKAYDDGNIIGELYSGNQVQVQDTSDNTYWYVYAPSLGKSGYVNRNYLINGSTVSNPVPAPSYVSDISGTTMTVQVSKGFLALRTAKAYDDSNIIGELYSGNQVQVQDASDNTYWYVYAPILGKSGYVNKNYLIGGNGAAIGSNPASQSSASYPAGRWVTNGNSGSVEVEFSSDYVYYYQYDYEDYSHTTVIDSWTDSIESITNIGNGFEIRLKDKSYMYKSNPDDPDDLWCYSVSGDTYYGSDSLRRISNASNANNYTTAGTNSVSNNANSGSGTNGTTMTVQVSKGFLALRTAKAYDDSNIIGELYTGNQVQVQDTSDNTYWYVYAPSLGKSGYVNRNYLIASATSSIEPVSVPNGGQTGAVPSNGMGAFLSGLSSSITGYNWQTVNGNKLSVPRSVAVTDLNSDGQQDLVVAQYKNYSAYMVFYLNENGSFREVLSAPLSIQAAGGVFSIAFLSSDPSARVQIYTASTDDFTDRCLTWYSFDSSGNLNKSNSVRHYTDEVTSEETFYLGDSQSISSDEYYQYLNGMWSSREEVLIYDNTFNRLEKELGPLPEMKAVTLEQAIAETAIQQTETDSPEHTANNQVQEKDPSSVLSEEQILQMLGSIYTGSNTVVSYNETVGNTMYVDIRYRGVGTLSRVYSLEINKDTLDVYEYKTVGDTGRTYNLLNEAGRSAE